MYAKKRAFTLVELLVVIGILVILAVVALLVINPGQLLMQSRDSNRITALSTLDTAVEYAQSQGASLGSPSIAYISIPDPTLTGNATSNCATLGLSAIPSMTYQCVSPTNVTKLDGTGWIPVALNTTPTGKSLGALPLDPVNTTSSGEYYIYTTKGGVYELVAKPEAVKDVSSNAFAQGSSISLLTSGPQHIWVVDETNSTIQEFTMSGGYVTQFGSFGLGHGQLSSPYGLSADSRGDIYTVTGNGSAYGNAIEEFTPTGGFLSEFSPGECSGGSLSEAYGVAIDAYNNIFMPNYGGSTPSHADCVTEINAVVPSPYLSQFGSAGAGNGQLTGPKGVAADDYDNMWVVDSGNNRVEGFSIPYHATGTYASQFGSAGTGNGQFNNPTGAFDDGSNLWVVDSGNDRVQEFDYTGAYVGQFGSAGAGNEQFNDPTGIAEDDNGNFWVADSGNNRIEEFDDTGAYIGQFGSAGTGNGQFNHPTDIAQDDAGNMWIVDSGNNRIQKFDDTGAYKAQFGSAGAGNGQFNDPSEITFDSNNDIWIVDNGNNRIQEFDDTGAYVAQTGSYGTGNGQFKNPIGITVDSYGNIYVTDGSNDNVQKFSSSNNAISQIGSYGASNGQFHNVTAVAIDPSGNVWATDSARHTIQEFSSSGVSISAITGSAGWDPDSIAIDASGNIYAGDSTNGNVQKFTSSGTLLYPLGSKGTGPGQFEAPAGIAIDNSGNVWVVDASNKNVQEFSGTGTSIAQFGSVGTGNGQFEDPKGIVIK